MLPIGYIAKFCPTGSTDFEHLQPIRFEISAEVRLFTTNDAITLEYDDTVILRFTPTSSLLIPGVEGAGEFVRDTATVNIIDNDRKCTYVESYKCTIYIDLKL